MKTTHTPGPWKRSSRMGFPVYTMDAFTISRRFETGYLGGGRQRSAVFFVLEHSLVPGFIGKYKTVKAAKSAATLYPSSRAALARAKGKS